VRENENLKKGGDGRGRGKIRKSEIKKIKTMGDGEGE
jgi:hypothetical protein